MMSSSVLSEGWASWADDSVPASHMNGGRWPMCHLWDPLEHGLWRVAGPAGLSSKVFFGFHHQTPVQFCHSVTGHLAIETVSLGV